MVPAKSAYRDPQAPSKTGQRRGGSMPISDIPIFSMLRTRMQWHQERQQVLADNVANADTPNFRPSDLSPPDFNRPPNAGGPVVLARTDPKHLTAGGSA